MSAIANANCPDAGGICAGSVPGVRPFAGAPFVCVPRCRRSDP